MSNLKTSLGGVVLACMLALTMCLGLGVSSAFATATVTGTNYYGNGAIEKGTSVSVLSVEGDAQDSIYVQVKRDGRIIGDRVPYEFGMNQNSQSGAAQAGQDRGGVLSLSIDNLDLSGNSTYTVTAFSDREETDVLYSGTIYGVYAALEDGTEELVGVHTGAAGEVAALVNFNASDKLYVNGQTFALTSTTPEVSGTKIVYHYASYVESETAEGTITYVDVNGNVIDTQSFAGISKDEPKTVDIDAVIAKEINGKTYYFRTVFFRNQVTLSNPGQLSYTISCKLMGEAAQTQSGFYKAAIRAVDQDGNVIMSDTVNVTGKYSYTLPAVIYKRVGDQINTYKLAGEQVLNFSAADDGITNGFRDVEVSYTRETIDASKQTVTFNLIDGTKAVGEDGRDLGIQTTQVSDDNPTAAPQETLDINGASYVLAGTTEKYAYTIGNTGYPVVNVYYVPKGYSAGNGKYTVTVNYVNFLTNEVIKSESFESLESDNADHEFTSVESFSQDGENYVRIAGQDAPILHSYYSGIASYVIYYRNVNDTISSDTVINTIRVVYVDGTSTTTGTTVIPGTTTITGGTTTTGTTDAAGALNADGTYNVFDGDENNQTLTNESGVDSNTERIDDIETPLASGLEGTNKAADAAMSVIYGLGALCAAVVIGGLIFFFVKRRKKNEARG